MTNDEVLAALRREVEQLSRTVQEAENLLSQKLGVYTIEEMRPIINYMQNLSERISDLERARMKQANSEARRWDHVYGDYMYEPSSLPGDSSDDGYA